MTRRRSAARPEPSRADATARGAEPVHGVREVLHEPGHPLDAAERAFLEPRFGHDFSRVRVHEGERADASARALAARAYTVGDHIVFGRGQYRPGDATGRAVLAHELAHVVQQSGAPAGPAGLTVGADDTAHEHAAHVASAALLAGGSPLVAAGGARGEIQRQPVSIDLQVPTPAEAERLRQQGLTLPKVANVDPRGHSDFVDQRLEAVGFSIYLGGHHLYVSGLPVPVMLPHEFVAPDITAVANHDGVIYPSREQALAAIPYGPYPAGQPFPMTYFRGPGGLVVPTYVTPASAPQTYKTMIEAQRELGRQVSNDLTIFALTMAGVQAVRGIIGVIARVVGRTRPPAPKARPVDAEPAPGGQAAQPRPPAAATGAEARGRELVRAARERGEEAVVNLGGAGARHEPQHAINVNNQAVSRKGIPNHVQADGSDIGKLFDAGSVDSVVGHNMAPGVIDWSRAASGAYRVLRPGGRFEYYWRGANADAQVCAQALRAAGFKDVQVVSDVLVFATKP